LKKSAFTDVSRLGDVLDSRFGESFLGEKFECGAEKTLADIGTPALATVRGGG